MENENVPELIEEVKEQKIEDSEQPEGEGEAVSPQLVEATEEGKHHLKIH